MLVRIALKKTRLFMKSTLTNILNKISMEKKEVDFFILENLKTYLKLEIKVKLKISNC